VAAWKVPLLHAAAKRLLTGADFRSLRAQMNAFRRENAWIEDSALFYALTTYEEGLVGVDWWEWPEKLRFRCASWTNWTS
jgi:4-alpha-glucanotransferase